MLELTVLIVCILLVLLFLYVNSNQISIETFENYYLQSCPTGYKTFYNSNSDVACCNGDVMANKCVGELQCTLTGPGTPDMPNCTKVIIDNYKTKSKTICPPSMPQYFENKAKQLYGCTSGDLNSTLDGPRNSSDAICKVYKDDIKNYTSKDSCRIQKQIDSVQCFGKNCTKSVIQPIPNAPVLIAINFTDNKGIYHTAYSSDSFINYLNHTNPKWRESGFDINKNIQVAEVAKAYYIDRTIEGNNVQWYT